MFQMWHQATFRPLGALPALKINIEYSLFEISEVNEKQFYLIHIYSPNNINTQPYI